MEDPLRYRSCCGSTLCTTRVASWRYLLAVKANSLLMTFGVAHRFLDAGTGASHLVGPFSVTRGSSLIDSCPVQHHRMLVKTPRSTATVAGRLTWGTNHSWLNPA